MKEFIENIAKLNDWVFDYGRVDFHNLLDRAHDDKVYLLLDPLSSSDTFGASGVVDSRTWTGSFLLGKSSSYNEKDYEDRYTKYIKPLMDESLAIFRMMVKCSGNYRFTSLTTIEVVNYNELDFNFDGLLVQFAIEDLEP